MKTALVLGGGGSKGAYEIGVWKALQECNVTIDLVCGTSIGALIGTMIVQDQYDKCYELWRDLSVEDVIYEGIDLDFDLEKLRQQKAKIPQIMKDYVKNKGVDITPFQHMVTQMFDAHAFFSSSIDFACVSVNVNELKPHIFTKKDMMQMKNPQDALLASASCFPIFPMHKIEEQYYVDGGYYDNVPVNLAFSMHMDQVIAVDLKSIGRKRVHRPQKNLIYIEPYLSLGNFLSFSQETISRNMKLGYYDTMKKFHRYIGYAYTFRLQDKKSVLSFQRQFQHHREKKPGMKGKMYLTQMYQKLFDYRLECRWQDYANYDIPILRWLDLCGLLWEIPYDEVWDFQAFLQAIKKAMMQHEKVEHIFQKEEMQTLPQQLKKDFVMYAIKQFQEEKNDPAWTTTLTQGAWKEGLWIALLCHFIFDNA